jgi:hypothetical protein
MQPRCRRTGVEQRLDSLFDAIQEGRFVQEIARVVAAQTKFREGNHIAVHGECLLCSLAHPVQIPRKIPDGGMDLRQRDAKHVVLR